MKLFKKIRKGFTLIELVVVIAVIAILSAVAVVSYISITNKAKQSSDQQAVAQMNTILAANDVLNLKSINDVYEAFKESQLDVKDYKPLVKDRYFFWDADANRIVYTDANYNVLYPESLKGTSKNEHQWYSLTQEMKKVELNTSDKVTIDTGSGTKEVAVKEIIPATETTHAQYNFAAETPEQLYSIGQELKEAMLSAPKSPTAVNGYKVVATDSCAFIIGDVTIELAEDLDMMGAAFNFSVKGNFTLKGNGHKITGVVNNKDFYVGSSKTQTGQKQPEQYGSGIVGYIEGDAVSKPATCLIEDVVIENSVFGFSETKGGGLVGYANKANVTFDKVTVKNCNMEAFEHSVGGFVGDVQAGDVKDKPGTPASIVNITLKRENKLIDCNLKLHEGKESEGAECYGAGYFIGRHVGPNLNIIKEDGGKFEQSGNTKTFGSKNKVKATQTSVNNAYKYWDNAEAGVAFTSEDL